MPSVPIPFTLLAMALGVISCVPDWLQLHIHADADAFPDGLRAPTDVDTLDVRVTSESHVWHERFVLEGDERALAESLTIFAGDVMSARVSVEVLASREFAAVAYRRRDNDLAGASGNVSIELQPFWPTVPVDYRFAAWPIPDSTTRLCTDSATLPRAVAECPSGIGEDGDMILQAADYDTDTVADVAIDRVTGLFWEVGHGANLDHEAAVSRCAELVRGGFSDWRLPTRIELVSLLDLGRADPAIAPGNFEATPSEHFWSRSAVTYSAANRWTVDFLDGDIDERDVGEVAHARCVRSGRAEEPDRYSSAARFETGADRVIDLATGLEWEETVPSAAVAWREAATRCKGLELGGNDDWRLPTFKELESLIDERRTEPAVNVAVFKGFTNGLYWTASVYARSPSEAHVVDFLAGHEGQASVTDSTVYPPPCVRAGDLERARWFP